MALQKAPKNSVKKNRKPWLQLKLIPRNRLNNPIRICMPLVQSQCSRPQIPKRQPRLRMKSNGLKLIPISKVFLTKLRGMLRVFWGKWIGMLILSLIAGLVPLKMLLKVMLKGEWMSIRINAILWYFRLNYLSLTGLGSKWWKLEKFAFLILLPGLKINLLAYPMRSMFFMRKEKSYILNKLKKVFLILVGLLKKD